MKKGKKTASLLLLILFASIKSHAYDFEVDGIYYGYDATNQSAYVTSGDNSYKGDITIPTTVTFNGKTMDVIAIGGGAFNGCGELKTIKLPSSITSINDYAFQGCINLHTIDFPNTLGKIGVGAFSGCTSLKTLIIPNSVTRIEDQAFDGCTGIETIIFEDGEADLKLGEHEAPLGNKDLYNYKEEIAPKYFYIGRYFGHHFDGGLAKIDYLDLSILSTEIISIGSNVTMVPFRADYDSQTNKLKAIYCLADNPPTISELTGAIYANTKLYVPLGSKSTYQSKEVWKQFFSIEEMEKEKMWKGQGTPNIDDNKNKCEKPTISYANGKLTFSCTTPNAKCQSTITDTDISSFSGNEVQLTATYIVSVYATASGYENSDVATATLCWLDTEPKTEGMTNNIASVRGNAILIQSYDGIINVSGVDDGETVSIYTTAGVMVGKEIAHGGYSSIATNIRGGEIAIIRIGNNSVKVVMQ